MGIKQQAGMMEWLVYMGIPWWSDVGVAKRVRGVGKACSSFRGPSRRCVGDASSGGVAEVSSGEVGSSRRDDLGISRCKASRRAPASVRSARWQS